MIRMDPFMRRMLAIGIVVVAGSVGASMGLTAWLTTDMDAESRAYGLLISAIIPGLVAPVAVSTIAWMAVRNHRLLLEVDRLANHDELTGLLNRRAFLSRGGAWLAERAEGRTVVALADLDHFKRVNDQLGHAAGDAALRHVAMRLRETAPEGSLLARLGGEEFVLLCDWAGLSETQAAMERVRDGIAASPCPVADGVDVAVTVSIGIAIATPGDSMDALLRRADAAMYAAKHGGRNQTRVAA
jgi:diguanylate cyclase (GGDEF)-like protein